MDNTTFQAASGSDLVVGELPYALNRKQVLSMQPTRPSSKQVKVLSLSSREDFKYKRYNITRDGFEMPEYNLYEITAAEDADGYIRQTIQKKRSLGNQAGFDFVGKNRTVVEYIKNRIKQIELCGNIPFELLMKDIYADLIRFHNGFLVKVRNEDISGGQLRFVKTVKGTKILKPVAAYFRVPPETMRIKNDQHGNPIKYLQEMPDGRSVQFKAEDVIHFTFNRRAGFNFAAPGLLPAIEDVRVLRRLEENVELLVDQHLFPLLVMKVGSPDAPPQLYDDGTDEIDLWANKFDTMPASGGLVVSYRHNFEVVEFNNVIPIDKYLDYFKKRVFASLGVSAIDMGEGEGMNRSTADTASAILINNVKDYQHELAAQINFEIVNELLLENFNISVLNEENIVRFKYNEIDLESMIKIQNHNWLGYTMNALTEDEMRMKNGYPAIELEQERQKLYLNTYEIPKTKAEGAVAMATKAATSNASINSAKSKQQPTNQHGKSSGPTKAKSSIDLPAEIDNIFTSIVENNLDLAHELASNWLFSIDLTNISSDDCTQIIDLLQNTVSDIHSLYHSNIHSEDSIKILILSKLKSLLSIYGINPNE